MIWTHPDQMTISSCLADVIPLKIQKTQKTLYKSKNDDFVELESNDNLNTTEKESSILYFCVDFK